MPFGEGQRGEERAIGPKRRKDRYYEKGCHVSWFCLPFFTLMYCSPVIMLLNDTKVTLSFTFYFLLTEHMFKGK